MISFFLPLYSDYRNIEKKIISYLDYKNNKEENKSIVVNTYKKGQTLTIKNTPFLGVFLIKTGLIEVAFKNIGGINKKTTMEPGRIIGIENMDKNYTEFGAVAKEDSLVWFFDKSYFIVLINKIFNTGNFKNQYIYKKEIFHEQ